MNIYAKQRGRTVYSLGGESNAAHNISGVLKLNCVS
jgi:hypothetical protein